MSAEPFFGHLSEIDAILGNLGRYKSVVVTHESPLTLCSLADESSVYLQSKHISLTEDLSPQVTDDIGYLALGICEQPDLIKWILEQTSKCTDTCLIVSKLEPIVATFGRGNATEFFQSLAKTEPRKPIICYTYLRRQLLESDFPADRLLSL